MSTSTVNFNNIIAKNQNNSNATEYQPRFKSLKDIHELIWQQIHNLQEEGDCEKKKVLLCRNLESFSGFGSNTHRYGVCMQVAYGLGRTFFIQQDEYSHFDGVFNWVKPESVKCGYLKNKYLYNKTNVCNAQNPSCYLSNGYDINNSHQVIEFNLIGTRFPYPRHIPGTLPNELKNNLLHLGIEIPYIWFTSQFLGYLLLRPNAEFNKTLSMLKEKINFSLPIVGFHIRHGDKLTSGEAKYINESIFVKEANAYYKNRNVTQKKVYIATDDIPALKIVEHLGPELNIISLPQSYLSIGLGNYLKKQFPKEIIESTLVDLYFLTSTNYVVCDLASNICRLVYELKQALPPFKQDDILKPVGEEKKIYYWWHNFFYPFSLWLTISNNASLVFGKESDKLLKILEYERDLFVQVDTTPIKNASHLLYMKRMTNKGKQDLGYVYKSDLMEWPGAPSYYYFS